jgi:hypothetical protein
MDNHSAKKETNSSSAPIENTKVLCKHEKTTPNVTGKDLKQNDASTVKALGTKVRNRFHEMKANRHQIVRIAESDVHAGLVRMLPKTCALNDATICDKEFNNQREGDGSRGVKDVLRNSTFTKSTKKSIRRKRRRWSNVENDIRDNGSQDNCTSSTIVDDWIPNISHILANHNVPPDEQLSTKENLKQKYSNVVQLHGLPTNTTLNSIRRFFSGLSVLRVVVLLPFESTAIRIDEWDAKNEENGGTNDNYELKRTSASKKKKMNINYRRIERCEPHVRIWVQFDSTPTALLACQRSREYITTAINKSDSIAGIKHPNQSTIVGEYDIGSGTCQDDEPAPNEVGKASVAVVPVLTRRVAKYVMNSISVDIRQLKGCMILDDKCPKITNDTPLIAIFGWIQMHLDPNVPKILLSATVHDLHLTCRFNANQTGTMIHDPVTLFPLFLNQNSISNSCAESRKKASAYDGLQQLANHCTFLEKTLYEIQVKNRPVMLLSLDVSCNHPIIVLTRAAVKIISKQIEFIKFKIIRRKRLEILGKEADFPSSNVASGMLYIQDSHDPC